MSRFTNPAAAAVVLFTLVTLPSVASAQVVAADLADIGTAISSSVAVLMPWALGLIAIVLGGSITLGLVKKFGRKAGS